MLLEVRNLCVESVDHLYSCLPGIVLYSILQLDTSHDQRTMALFHVDDDNEPGLNNTLRARAPKSKGKGILSVYERDAGLPAKTAPSKCS